MSEAIALVADATPAMRDLLCDTLREIGYRSLHADTLRELAERVGSPELLLAPATLLVVGSSWAAQCAVPISAAASARDQAGRARLKVVVLCEWGTRRIIDHPELTHSELLAVLEKPFDMLELAELARIPSTQVA